MRKLIPILVLLVLILTTTAAIAAPKDSVFVVWRSGDNSGYFFDTSSGLVHAWTVDHYRPDFQDGTHWVIKPTDKFPNAMCDAESIYSVYNWTPRPLYNSANAVSSAYGDAFHSVFPDLDQEYVLCVYPTY